MVDDVTGSNPFLDKGALEGRLRSVVDIDGSDKVFPGEIGNRKVQAVPNGGEFHDARLMEIIECYMCINTGLVKRKNSCTRLGYR